MKVAKRVGLEVLGWSLLVLGIAALILPGPGLLLLAAGMFVLSQQYEWAERRLDPIEQRALKAAADGVKTLPRVAISGLGVLGLLAFAALWIVAPPVPGWWPLGDSLWLPGGVGTASTLVLSGLIALGLLVYSYRRFHGRPEAVAALEKNIDQADEDVRGG